MGIFEELMNRSGNSCELCGSASGLQEYEVKPSSNRGGDDFVFVCGHCFEQLNDSSKIEPIHWRCLNESMWSPVPAVQVVSYRMLSALKGEGWPVDLLDQMYMEEDVLKWAQAGMTDDDAVPHKDSNGAILSAGDNVVLIKDLEVKGAGFTAKRGTVVRGIALVENNPQQIEGRVNGQQIVILTQFVKKG